MPVAMQYAVRSYWLEFEFIACPSHLLRRQNKHGHFVWAQVFVAHGALGVGERQSSSPPVLPHEDPDRQQCGQWSWLQPHHEWVPQQQYVCYQHHQWWQQLLQSGGECLCYSKVQCVDVPYFNLLCGLLVHHASCNKNSIAATASL